MLGCRGLPSGISLEDCLFLVLLGEWTMPPPHQTGLLHFSPPVAACWRGEGTFPIHHPPRRPSSPSLHQQNRKASPSSLSSFCPPCIRFLRRAPSSSTRCAVGGTLCPVSSEVCLCFPHCIGTAPSKIIHVLGALVQTSLPSVVWFLPRTRRPCIAYDLERRNKYRVTMEIRSTSKLFLVVFATVLDFSVLLH